MNSNGGSTGYAAMTIAVLAGVRAVLAAELIAATSPDGWLSAAIAADTAGGFAWSLSARGQALLANAALGLDLGAAGRMPGTGWRAAKTASRSVNDVWKPVWGKRAVVPDRYNETTVDFEGAGAPFGTLRIVLRAYDDGVAFRYEVPAEAPGAGVRAAGELTTFAFAAESGIRHLVLDADWYGPEFEHTSDPTQGDKAADVRKLIAYGKRKGVGIWLYLNDVGGRKYPIGDTLKQYGEWGAAGVKYGFMKGTPAEKNARTRTITELCAKNRLLVDYHDGPVHPYGQMRTWPNAVTREFCHAQLDARRVFVPKTFVTTVFVNMLAGPLDMNNGMFDLRQGKTDRVDNAQEVPSTLAAEAARTLIVFSGATIIPDVPEYYRKYPDLLAFISAQQMPWRESRTLSGAIGEHIVMARQAANGAWLVGAATDETARELDLPCSFLGAGAWKARIVEDGADAHYLTKRESLKASDRTVTAADTIRVRLAPGGGACVLLRPE